jgi:RNA polymerase sigma-70 factor (ECF subfamily)
LTEKQAIYYELLVLRCQQGQKEAFEELVRSWEKRLFFYVRRLVDDEQDAWQMLQQTWVKVLRGIKKLRQPRKLPAWLYGIAHNTAIDHLRTKHSEQVLIEDNADVSNIEDCNSTLIFDDVEQVYYGLGRISLPHREVLTLFFLQDLSTDEIAQVLGISIGTVKSRLYYAKRALKAILEKEDSEL